MWIAPVVVRAGATSTLTVTGAGFTPGAQVAVTGEGIEATKVVVESDTEITATLAVAAGAKPGTREVSVTGPGGASNPLNLRLTAGR
jgi:hypothetical protein